jgi:hypothetical protein
MGDVGRLQNVALTAITQDQSRAFQARIVRLAAVVDHNHRHIRGVEMFEDSRPHPTQTAQNDRRLHAVPPSWLSSTPG